jgi:branched-chain amino acid aminotransferase
LFDGGVNGVITRQRTVSNSQIDPKIKNRSRVHYQMANIETSFYKGENNWPILLDDQGFIAEGSGDNLFFVKDGKVITPKGHNILRGISRDYIFELCEELGLECIEEDLTPYDAYICDECFMTATPFCILPVSTINYLSLNSGNGEMGPITKQLLSKWSENVGVDIAQQIKEFNDEFKLNGDAPTPYNFKEKK